MDDLQSSEEAAFVPDEVVNIIKDAADQILGPHNYHHSRVAPWCSKIVEEVLKRLADQHKPFKYVVTTIIMQKNGAGLHTASSCYWDNSTDNSCSYKWSNSTMFCITTVFGLAI
ncbi:dynein light chain Tctex-type 1 [Thecamonas trahens ATCC 50062]|uniref:Dynein light chain Tctex-type 1 n=1 Tax=Thecamonas trahens ATCC 50062 TaxID=461836 RepID=A0A0L0DEH7_THETB|nr:dynein light chain Tctex-type 1 [Thecamonas trahens ATCC 50062]KNC50704.1 dynein light chain Tctex-type 1 [Thecamonas trahens ATCC 50062]|eukprot:XP_013762581.1 dynein light chain Tctex-type 1 [Thecamonas trahens ATCC 50062]